MTKLDYVTSFRDLLVVSKLTDADGEQQETQHWIETAFDREYISQEQEKILLEECAEIGRLLGGMIAKAEQFCNPSPYKIREEHADYFIVSFPSTED